jgi:hypothetical protein
MRFALLATGMLSIALWMTIREQAFATNTTLAWVATVLLLGWGAFGIFQTLKKRPENEDKQS